MSNEVITDLEEAINKEALQLIQEDGLPISDRLDRFKAVSAYYIGMRKVRGAKSEDPSPNSFETLVNKISRANSEDQ
jgi:hypothetical protein